MSAKELATLKQRVANLERAVEIKDKDIQRLRTYLQGSWAEVNRLNNELNDKNHTIAALEAVIEDK